MCSLNVEEGSCDIKYPEKFSLSELTTCRSCENKAIVVLRKKDAYCKECFLLSETHKFRAALGKTKMMKPQDKVLVAYSGSQSSTALLHLLQSGVSEKHHKKLLFSVVVLHIEEGILFKMSNVDRSNSVEEIKQSAKSFQFPLFITTISECLNPVPSAKSLFEINVEKDAELVELFDHAKTLTSKSELLNILRLSLIKNIAKEFKCTKIFTAETGNDLAVKLFCNFSLGRGDQASYETGFCDDRNPDCKILRPLKDFLKKEIVFYNKFHNLQPVNIRTFTTKSQPNASIQKLAEKFITDLQVDFPSTVYTIFRTGEKLSVNVKEENKNVYDCILCGSKCGTESGDEYTAVDALYFSKNMSRNIAKGCESGNSCVSCSNQKKKMNICYSCQEIVDELGDGLMHLPKSLIDAAIQKQKLEEMKNEISEFLIEDA